jgi:4-amino-4-deoxy-L-arabinose transferase-like glycosyltransferase
MELIPPVAATVTSSQAPPVSEDLRERAPLGFPTPGQLFALFLAYFLLQVLIRTFLSSSVDLDESEQVMLTQKFNWGYGTDPPLYTWIQMGFFAVFGKGVFALALWKNLVLLATYGFVYASTRVLTRSHQCGAAAALSLLFMPHMVWEAQRDLTHTILACACAGGTLFTFLRAHKTKATRWYLALGLCVGMGLLSKFNFGIWAVGLVLAALSLREFRAAVLTPRMLLAVAVGLLLIVPTGLWGVTHRDMVLHTSAKLQVQGSETWLGAVGLGVWHILLAILAFIGPLSLVYLLLFGKAPKSAAAPSVPPAGAKLVARAFLFILTLLVLLVVCFRATGFRERWFQPFLICAPVLALGLLCHRVDARRVRGMTVLGIAVMVVVAVCIPARIVFIERLKREEPLSRPYAELARQMQPALPAGTLLVTDTIVLGGNVHLTLPQQRVAVPELAKLFGEGMPHCAIAWDASERDLPTKALRAWVQAAGFGDVARAQPQYFTATYKFHHARQYRVGLLVLY